MRRIWNWPWGWMVLTLGLVEGGGVPVWRLLLAGIPLARAAELFERNGDGRVTEAGEG